MERLKQYYAILDIQPGASLERVRQAYVAAEKQMHAQRHAESALVRGKAQARLKLVNEAYLAIVNTYEEVQASLTEQNGNLPPVRGKLLRPLPSTAPANHEEALPPSDAVTDSTGTNGQSDAGISSPPSPSAIDAEISPDPAGLLQKEIFLFVTVLVVLFLMLLVIRWRPDRRQSPPATRTNAATPAEKAEQSGSALPYPREGKPDVATVRRDAEQGNTKAQALVGFFYANGIGVPKDFTEAAGWFAQAASQGDAEAQDWLGYLYETGQGVARNYDEAAKLYRLAAEQGNADAEKNLGLMYVKGLGVPRNRQEAVKWLQKAAAQGNKEAEQTLKRWQGE